VDCKNESKSALHPTDRMSTSPLVSVRSFYSKSEGKLYIVLS